jgi:hypothetical protein
MSKLNQQAIKYRKSKPKEIGSKYKDKNLLKKNKIKTENIFKKHKIFQKDEEWKLIDKFYNHIKDINNKYNRTDLLMLYIKLANELIDKEITKSSETFEGVVESFEKSCKINATVEDVMNDLGLMLGDENK